MLAHQSMEIMLGSSASNDLVLRIIPEERVPSIYMGEYRASGNSAIDCFERKG